MPENFVDFETEMAPTLFARQMFEKTANDGMLYLKNWYDVDCEDCLTCNDFSAKIKWSDNEFEEVLTQYEKLFVELRIIAQHYNELDGTHETAEKMLPNESVISAYFIFVAPFEAQNDNQLFAQIMGRVGDGLCGYNIITHSQRLCKLLALKAPKSVIHREGRMLIASLAIWAYGEKIEKL